MSKENAHIGFRKSRFYTISIGLMLFGFLLIGKLIYIQFYSNNDGLGIAPETLVKNVVLEPSRGDIYAADGNILATSVARYRLHWDALTVSESLFQSSKLALADSIAKLKGMASARVLKELETARKQKNRYWLVANDISYSTYRRYKSFPIFNLKTYKGGLIAEQEIKREHPLGKIAERTVGYEKRDTDGTYFRVE